MYSPLETRDKVYFHNGDLVTLKQDLPNKPTMLVERVEKATIQDNKTTKLMGVTCIWFSSDMIMQRNRFSTKDLIHVDEK